MIAPRAASIERAIAEGLGLVAGRARVLRSARLEITLPSGIVQATEGDAIDALIASLDAASLADVAAQLGSLASATPIAWVMPVTRSGPLSWALARVRGLRPIELEDACDALRRAGVVDVRVTDVAGSLPIAVLTGRTTQP